MKTSKIQRVIAAMEAERDVLQHAIDKLRASDGPTLPPRKPKPAKATAPETKS